MEVLTPGLDPPGKVRVHHELVHAGVVEGPAGGQLHDESVVEGGELRDAQAVLVREPQHLQFALPVDSELHQRDHRDVNRMRRGGTRHVPEGSIPLTQFLRIVSLRLQQP